MFIKFLLKEDPSILKDKIFVTGFQGIGFAGYIAVSHMVKQLNARAIGYVLSDMLPPLVSMDDGRLALPYTFFLADDMVILIPEVVPDQRERGILLRRMSSWIKAKGIREAILFGGLMNEFKKNEDELARIAYTSSYNIKSRAELLPPTIEKGLLVVGPIATLMAFFEAYGIPAISILSYVDPNRPDPMGAANAIRVFSKIYGKTIDVTELEKDARRIEQEISEAEKKKLLQESGSAGQGTLYVRRLQQVCYLSEVKLADRPASTNALKSSASPITFTSLSLIKGGSLSLRNLTSSS
ncbi:MAG: proteasome assembly chaperone family protein [Thermoprotei archaeon]